MIDKPSSKLAIYDLLVVCLKATYTCCNKSRSLHWILVRFDFNLKCINNV